ncbi:spore germination protein [Priestia megaterium]|jgi:hypothetical protein|uniref:spore germination protein n=1 Tax=Priestia megaterium TaxID=1404 RepID=UPI002E1C8A12|nr:spore germination protein [Priestia megaterium]MED4289951.1 spore germination protein [Priestia megaterium]MED4293447.1 spore germination protein [Priestia megaterium]
MLVNSMTTNGVTQNANIYFGSTIQNRHTANSKFNGANFSLGNFSPTCSQMNTGVLDPDVSDQD